MRRRGYGDKRRKSWIEAREKVKAALSENWMRNKDLEKVTNLAESTLALHLRDLVDDGTADRWVDAGSGKHPPPTYYRLTQLESTGESSITLRGLTRLRIGDSLIPSIYVDGGVTLDEQTTEEVTGMLRRADSILAELILTLELEGRRSRLARRISGLLGFEEVDELREILDTFLSFEDRYERAKVAGTAEEEVRIRAEEEAFLGGRVASYRELDPGDSIYSEINLSLRDTPLTAEGYGALCELRRRMEGLIDPAALDRLLKEPGPAVCLVASSVGVRVVTESVPSSSHEDVSS